MHEDRAPGIHLVTDPGDHVVKVAYRGRGELRDVLVAVGDVASEKDRLVVVGFVAYLKHGSYPGG
jgi:hypothetical protein